MGVRSYLRVVRAYWVLLVVGLTAGLAVAGVVTMAQTPTYASEITMILAPAAPTDASNAYEGSVLSTEKASSYSQLLSGEPLAGEVAARLALDTTPAELAGRITSSVRPDTSLITARVTADSPAGAQQIAGTLGERYAALIAGLERPANRTGAPTLTVRAVAPPSISDEAVSPQQMPAFGLGGILGLLAGLAVAVGVERVRRPVRSPDDVADLGPALGSVPAERDQDAMTSAERVPAELAESFRRIRARLVLGPARRPGHVIGVVSPCAGDGRSVVASNLALALSRTGRRVVLVDADLRAARLSAAMAQDDVIWPGLTEVIAGSVPLEPALHPRSSHPLHVLPAGAAPPPGADPLGSWAFGATLAELAAGHDVVVIDTPALGRVADALDVASLCHGVVLVARHGRTGQDDLRSAADSVRSVGGRILGVVVNAVPGGRRRAARRAHGARTDDPGPSAFPQPAAPGGNDAHVPVVVLPADRSETFADAAPVVGAFASSPADPRPHPRPDPR